MPQVKGMTKGSRAPAILASLGLLLLSCLPARSETMLFGVLPVPDETDVRMQVIERQPREAWPFAVERGWLVCVPLFLGLTAVYFLDDKRSRNGAAPRIIEVSVDPFVMWFYRDSPLLAVEGNLDTLTRAMIPYLETGQTLCGQDGGTRLGPGGI